MRILKDQYRGARVLVVGGAGFIGSWMARALAAADAQVFRAMRRRVPGHGVIELDICDSRQIRRLFRALNPAITFNLSGYGVDPSERDELLAHSVNAVAVEEICRAMAEWGDRSWPGQALVHAGSALEYGAIPGNLCEDSAVLATTLYGRTKLAGTRVVEHWSAVMRAATARLFTVYGPGEHPGRLLPSLIEAARRGTTISLTSGSQRRDFTYVADVVEGLLRLGLCREPGVGTVNLATGRLTTVREFVETAARMLAIPVERLEFGALPVRCEEMNHQPVCLHKLDKLIGWRPPTKIVEGIQKTVDQLNPQEKLVCDCSSLTSATIN